MSRLRNEIAGWTLIALACLPILGGRPAPALAQSEQAVGVAEMDSRTEAAIDRGLKFLANRQGKDGSWGSNHRAAVTSLCLMAFMLQGHFPEEGPYGEKMDNGVKFLIEQARQGGGYFGGSMYEHGLATLALSEVWGMTHQKEVRDTLKRAVDVILKSQNSAGGWRYDPKPSSADVSVTVMQIVALASAKEAGIYVPDSTIERAVRYVKSLQGPTGGFGYTSAQGPGFARTAAGVMSLIMTGQRKAVATERGLAYLTQYAQSGKVFQNESHFTYGHYYAIQAVYQAGDKYYQSWYPKIRDSILAKQGKGGDFDRRQGDVGAEYTTAMSILILGVPYRYLPIYQR